MDILKTIIDAIWVNGLNLSHKKCLCALIRALLITLSVNLLKLARATFPQTMPSSTIRRIERLLGMNIFNLTSVGRAIIKTMPPRKRYILTMDRTTWELGKRVYNILAIGICFDGISIPVYFSALPKRGATNFTEQISFMEHVLDIIPPEQIECLVADREFGFPNFIRWLELMKIPYCLRLRENSYISDTADRHSRKAKTLLSSLPAGQCIVLSHSYLVNRRIIAYACAYIEGLLRIRKNAIPIMRGNGRKRFSIFTWGLDLLTATIWQHIISRGNDGQKNSS